MKHSYLLIGLLILAGCDSAITLDFSNVNSDNAPQLGTAITYADWTTVQAGIDFKQTLITVDTHTELLDIVRIDPTQATLELLVNEADPQTVSAWQQTTNAIVAINGSYFDDLYQLVTRTKTADDSYGPMLSGETGSLANTAGAWQITRAIPDQPDQMIQSYPLLVQTGAATIDSDSTDTAQRTVVATDAQGRLYFIVAEYGVLTLAQLADALAGLTDPVLDMALNLDGGSSTGLAIRSTAVNYLDDSFVVPSVVVLY